MTSEWARAALGCALFVFAACDAVSFESLGKLPASGSGSAAPGADAGPRDAAAPQLTQDTAPVTPPALSADAGMRTRGDAALSSSGAAGMSAAAGSGGAAAVPRALGGSLDSMPFAVRDGYVAGLSEFQETSLYLFDSSVSCSQLASFAWLAQLPSSTLVLEITFAASAQAGTPVTNASISYMRGGTTAFSEIRATSSMLILSHVTQGGAIDGTLEATFGADLIEGAFHAEYCARGTVL